MGRSLGGHMKLETDGITMVRIFENPRAKGTPMHPKCSFLNIDVIDAPRGWCVGSHTHDFFEILHPFSGIYTCALNGTPLSLAPGQTVEALAGPDGAKAMLLGGATLDGPRHIWWNFVSSNKERIEKAKADWREQRFAMVAGDPEFIPLPDR